MTQNHRDLTTELKSYRESLENLLKLEKKLIVSRRESATKVCDLKNKKWNFYSSQIHLKDLVCTESCKDNVKLKNQGKTIQCHREVTDDVFQTAGVNKLTPNSINENQTLFSNEKLHENTKYDLSLLNYNDDQFSTLSFEKKVLSDDIANSTICPNSFSNISDLKIYSEDKEKLRNVKKEIYDPADLVKHLNSVCCNLINQNSRDEELLSAYLNIMLNIKEKAVISSAKQKLSRLKIRDSASDPLSLKKKQRGLLIKLQHEYNEIKFMKNFQKRLLDERKKVLQQQARHFKTISGINSLDKNSKINNNLNLKGSVPVLKERNKKLPIKCYDIALNFKKKNDLFEKRIILRSHKKTLNELLSLYFDLQLNAAALYTINQKSTHSQIIATLKEISQKTSNKMNNIIDYTPQKNIECIISDNNDLNKSSISLTSRFSDPNIFPVAGAISDVLKLTATSVSFSEPSDSVKSVKPQKNDIVAEVSLKLPIENFCDKREPSEKVFYNYDYKKKHCFCIFDKEYVFSNRILNFQRDTKRKCLVDKIKGFSSINLVNSSKFLITFVSESGYIENIFSNVNFERSIINRDVISFLRTFHLYVKKFIQYTNTKSYIIDENENSLALKSFFHENNICMGENNARIQIKKFSLDGISKIINAMMQIFSDDFENLSSENFKYIHFFVKIKENTSIDSLDLDCFVYQNVSQNIKVDIKQDAQIWEIHDVSFVEASVKSKLSIANGTSLPSIGEQLKSFKSHQFHDSQNVVPKDIKPIKMNSSNTKCKQLDLPFKDDCYQKISDIQTGRKISFGKQFNKNNQETFIEKELISQVFEQNTSSKLLPFPTLKSINQLEEAEELRRKQLAVEMEIKALLEQQTSQFSYFMVREIPDKPPPPYIPPENKVDFMSVQLPKNNVVFRSEQVNDIVEVCYDNIWRFFLSKSYSDNCDTSKILNDQYTKFKKDSSINNCFVFDLCNEMFSFKFKNVRKKSYPWEYRKRLKYSKGDVCKSIESLAMQCLGYGNNLWKDSIFINCAHKIQDHVDELLIKELQDEEAEWVNIEEYETSVKNIVTESILNSLLRNTIQEYMMLIGDD